MKTYLLIVIGLCWLGCGGTRLATNRASDAGAITVEGRVTTRGNTPFTALMLETDQNNLYVLVLDEAEERALAPGLPARFRITGVVYAGEWNGIRLAHLRAASVERL